MLMTTAMTVALMIRDQDTMIDSSLTPGRTFDAADRNARRIHAGRLRLGCDGTGPVP
jgi:hypothetical protein